MNNALKIVGLGATVASLYLHLLTFFPSIKISMGQVFYMHFIVLLLFGSVFLSLRGHVKYDKVAISMKSRLNAFLRVIKTIPNYAILIAICSFLYAFINFSIFLTLMEGGSPEENNGIYYLHNHGQKIRDLTFSEYQRFLAYEVRGFSGHWIIFSLIPTIFYFYRDSILNAIKTNDGT